MPTVNKKITYVEQLEGVARPALAPIDYQPEHQKQQQPSESDQDDQEGQEGGGSGESEEQEQEGEGQGDSQDGEGDGEEQEGEDESSGGEPDLDDKDGSKSINTYVLADNDLVLTSKRAHYCNLQNEYSEEDIEREVAYYLENRDAIIRRLKDLFTYRGYSKGQLLGYLGTNHVKEGSVVLSHVVTRRDIEEALGGKISEVCAKDKKHEDAPEDVGFALQLRNVMTDNKYDRMLSGRRNGTLDGNMLYKVPAGDIKAFKKRESRQNKDYHFTLLVDQSRSMEGTESRQAADLGVSLYKSFERAGINYSCYGYSDYTATYKHFDDHLDPDALYNMLLWNANGNNEYPALVDAYSRFPRCASNNNFVILLSDGGIDSSQQDKMVEFCKKNARVATLIGLGIGSGARPMPFCDIDIQRNTIPEAKVELLRQLRNVIRRG